MFRHKRAITRLIITLLSVTILTNLILISPVYAQQDKLPIYVVQSGDTLSSIALRFNVSPDELASNNEINDPNLLAIGTRLKIPGLEGITGILTTQVIPFGTTLNSLSRQNRLDKNALIKLNKFTSPAEAFAGIKMVVPIEDDTPALNPIAPLASGQSLLELSAINQSNPWVLSYLNSIDGTWDALPYELLYRLPDDQAQITTALPNVLNIEIDSLPLVQGETVVIRINTNDTLNIEAEVAGKSLHFFSETTNEYIALHGISAIAEPGAFPFNLQVTPESGQTYEFEQWVLVAPGFYDNDPEIYVDSKYVDADTIATEEEVYEQIISPATPTRLWEGPFSPPVGEPICIRGWFGNRRSYNDGALLYYHTGIDYGVCADLNIYATAKGIVVYADESIIRGNTIIIDHGWGVYTVYCHLSEFHATVGDKVKQGQLIALIGSTGRATGPHLHFEIRVNGTAVNPLTWLGKTFP